MVRGDAEMAHAGNRPVGAKTLREITGAPLIAYQRAARRTLLSCHRELLFSLRAGPRFLNSIPSASNASQTLIAIFVTGPATLDGARAALGYLSTLDEEGHVPNIA
jgi:hypothetical protein